MNHSHVLGASLVSLLAFGGLAAGCAQPTVGAQGENVGELSEASYVVTRPDLRECTWPACGGVYVAEVNASETTCADGNKAAECYVAALDWSALAPSEEQRSALDQDAVGRELVLRGRLSSDDGYGRLQVLDAQHTVAGGTLSADETLYTVRFNGLMCVTSPCPSFDAIPLGGDELERVAAVNLEAIDMSESERAAVYAAMGSDAGLVVAATRFEVSGAAGNAPGLRVSSALLPVELESGADSCPATDDPAVHYASEDPDTCRVILFHCEEGQEYFGGDCGCGCVDVP